VVTVTDWSSSVPTGLTLYALSYAQAGTAYNAPVNFLWALAGEQSWQTTGYTGDYALINVNGIFPVCADPGQTRICVGASVSGSSYTMDDGDGTGPQVKPTLIFPVGSTVSFGLVDGSATSTIGFVISNAPDAGTVVATMPSSGGYTQVDFAGLPNTAYYYWTNVGNLGKGGKLCWGTCPAVTGASTSSSTQAVSSTATTPCGNTEGVQCCASPPAGYLGDLCAPINIARGYYDTTSPCHGNPSCRCLCMTGVATTINDPNYDHCCQAVTGACCVGGSAGTGGTCQILAGDAACILAGGVYVGDASSTCNAGNCVGAPLAQIPPVPAPAVVGPPTTMPPPPSPTLTRSSTAPSTQQSSPNVQPSSAGRVVVF